jgi:CubicO group peptidase (beta-lactamase class C family)
MKHRPFLVRALGGLALLSLAMLSMKGTEYMANQSTGDYAAVDAYMQAQIESWRVPGAALVIVENGQVVHQGGFGKADASGQAVTALTPFEIGSCSKSFTALAVMQLEELNRLQLDEPVQTYLPWFRVRDDALTGQITLRTLLNHTSGIPLNASFRLMNNLDGSTLQEQVERLKDARLASSPGHTYQYNNYNYMILALVIEAVTGQSYGDYIQQHIFAPLDMRSSYTDMNTARNMGIADGHTWWFGIPVRGQPRNRPDMLGAGFLVTSANDMGSYLLAYLEGGAYAGKRLLSAEGISRMHQRPVLSGGESPYGFGWVRYPENNIDIVNHNGASPGFTCSMILVPERKLGVAVLTNSGMHSVNAKLHPAWEMANQVKNMLVIDAPGVISSEYGQFFRIWNTAHLALSVLIVSSLGYEVYRLLSGGPPSQSWVSLAIHGLLALVCLAGLPVGLGVFRWLGLFVYMPDAIWWCLLAGVLLLAKTVLSRV